MSVTPPQPPIESGEVLDLLTSLVQKSLVVYEEDERGQGRYGLLDTVRQYARDRLLESGEGEAVRERHRDWFLALAEQAEPELGHQQAWLDRLEREHDNLRAALAWSREQGQGEAGLRLGGAVWRFWDARGYWSEGREHLAGLLALPGAEARTAARAHAVGSAGLLARNQGDYGAARALFEESLAIHEQQGEKQGIAQDLEGLAAVAVTQSHSERAARLFGAAEALREAIGAPLPPAARAEHARSVAAAHAALGEEAFATAWAEGRVLSLEQAIAEALAEAAVVDSRCSGSC